MSTPKKSFMDRLVAALGSPKARRALDEALAESEEPAAKKAEEKKPEPAAADDATEERLAALEAGMEEIKITLRQLAKAEEEEAQATDEDDPEAASDEDDPQAATDEDESAKKTTDSAARLKAKARDARVVDADTRLRAKLLSPGIRIDDADKVCAVQRAALRTAVADKVLGGAVKAALRGAALDTCDCVTLDAAFVAASEVAKVRNNGRTADGLSKVTVKDFGTATTPADINKANEAAHAERRK